MLGVSTWLNSLYHSTSGQKVEGVDLVTALSYATASAFAIRVPHGIAICRTLMRWEDEKFRTCFADIVSGQWTKHDPYALEPHLEARTSLYRKPNYSTSNVFRTFQGWLALSKTAPGQGTLKVFPDVLLSNAYIILRPFFRPLVPLDSKEILDVDISTPDFPGIICLDSGFGGPKPTTELHPHLLLDATMTSVPAVNPGDTVFWHCDVVHSVEEELTGSEDSAVMYIPAVPLTPANAHYVECQKGNFFKGVPPPDFPTAVTGVGLVGLGSAKDIEEPLGRKAIDVPDDPVLHMFRLDVQVQQVNDYAFNGLSQELPPLPPLPASYPTHDEPNDRDVDAAAADDHPAASQDIDLELSERSILAGKRKRTKSTRAVEGTSAGPSKKLSHHG
ncbi:hypothetical protein B0H14DRAFT_3863581 [Mycena olivaceomarginata]|nr:hypothetical protein B0H14DRAFT_3863581 [Mycena olivaceomarginata]